jgi:hypothetical protein
MKNKIYITVEGGVVQDIYSESGNEQVIMIDLDDANCDEVTAARCEGLLKEAKQYKLIY